MSSAIPTPSPTVTFSVIQKEKNNNNRRFQGNLFLLGKPFPEEQTPSSLGNLHLETAALPNSQNFIIFGRESGYNHISIGSRASHGFYSEVNEPSLFLDSGSRSSTIIGDINSDGFEDLLIGLPQASKCFIYLGSSTTDFTNLVVSLAIYGTVGDDFGWSATGLGDYNQDTIDDFLVSAKNRGIIYLFYGKTTIQKEIYLDHFTKADGFKIIGQDGTFFTGLALSHAGDFNQDGFPDILLSSVTASTEGIIFLLFGNPHSQEDMNLNYFNTSHGFKFKAPSLSFSGLSLAGLGDFNHDGFDDIAIGSIPFKGSFATQVTYVVFGRNYSFSSDHSYSLVDLKEGIEGFTIAGGGFLVAGVGDVNKDDIPDLMITNYPNWFSQQGNAYLLQFPHNISGSPTYRPSSLPSSSPSNPPTSHPSVPICSPTSLPSIDFFENKALSTNKNISSNSTNNNNNNSTLTIPTVNPTPRKTFRPSLSKTPLPTTTLKPSNSPTTPPTKFVLPHASTANFNFKTFYPTIQAKQTSIPSIPYRRSPTTPSPSTAFPTFNISSLYDGVTSTHVLREGHYNSSSFTNVLFLIESSGEVVITGSEIGRNIYKFFPNDQMTTIIINNFDVSLDQLDFLAFPLFVTINDVPYNTNPLTIFPANKYQIVLLSVDSLQTISSSNFIFSLPDSKDSSSPKTKLELWDVLVIILIPILVVVVCVFYYCAGVLDKNKIEDGLDHDNDNLFGKEILLPLEEDHPVENVPLFEEDLLLTLPEEALFPSPPQEEMNEPAKAPSLVSHSSSYSSSSSSSFSSFSSTSLPSFKFSSSSASASIASLGSHWLSSDGAEWNGNKSKSEVISVDELKEITTKIFYSHSRPIVPAVLVVAAPYGNSHNDSHRDLELGLPENTKRRMAIIPDDDDLSSTDFHKLFEDIQPHQGGKDTEEEEFQTDDSERTLDSL
jgi:hypothetical protein